MSYKTVGVFALGALVIALGIALRVSGLGGTLLTPLQSGVSAAAEWVTERLEFGYREKYEAAQTELDTLRSALAEQEDAVHTAAFYRQFLELKNTRSSFSFCEARVIAAKEDSFTINVGTVDGVSDGQPVMTVSGLVGVIAETGLNWARVHTLSHKAVKVSVVCTRTAEVADMSGGTVRLSRDTNATGGDSVMTSGYGGAYPRGLIIGQLQTVTADTGGLSKTAAVRLFAELPTRVMVVTEF